MYCSNLLICGGDLVGKSSLMNALVEEFPRAETHHGTPLKGVIPSVWNALMDSTVKYWDANNYAEKVTIWDRIFFVSDLVYNPYSQESDLFKTVEVLKPHEWGKRNVTVVIITIKDPHILEKRYQERGDEFVTLEETLEANRKYRELAKKFIKLGVPVSWIDIDAELMEATPKQLAALVKEDMDMSDETLLKIGRRKING